jgi:hypothetical protein
MMKISINEDVGGEKLIELMGFVNMRSDSISVSRYYTTKNRYGEGLK